MSLSMNESEENGKSSHFYIPKMPDFLYDTVEMVLTSKSIEYFKRARDKQGFVGIVELCPDEVTSKGRKLARIHLIPADNKESGALAGVDREGKKMDTLASLQRLGTFTGDLHMRAAGALGLGEKGGVNGMLMGFGIWKSGCGVKFLDYLPPREALIPNEYLLIKEDKEWKLYFTKIYGDHPEASPREIENIPGLQDALDRLPSEKSLYTLTYEDRFEVESLLRNTEEAKIEPEGEICVVKNRSTSQNAFSIDRTGRDARLFKAYFDMEVKFHNAHVTQFVRELPLSVFEKIITNTTQQLGVTPILSLVQAVTRIGMACSEFVMGDISGPGIHLEHEKRWLEMRQEERESYVMAKAIKLNRPDIVSHLIKDLKIDPNKPICEVIRGQAPLFIDFLGKNLFTPFDYALKNESTETIEILKENGASDTVSPFIAAMKNDNFDACLQLIEEGADINTIGSDGKTLLARAIDNKNFDVCKILIEKGANINLSYFNNEPALVAAARTGNVEFCLMLIDKGADVNMKNFKGKTALHIATENGDVNLVSELIKRKADINAKDQYGKTPLQTALYKEQFAICLQLIDFGADINTIQYGKNILHMAIDKEDVSACENLIKKGVNLNIEVYHECPLLLAVRKMNIEICSMLIDNGVSVNFKNQYDQTPLNVAASLEATEHERIKLCTTLIQKGADYNEEGFQKVINKPKNKALKEAIGKAIIEIEKAKDINISEQNQRPMGVLLRQRPLFGPDVSSEHADFKKTLDELKQTISAFKENRPVKRDFLAGQRAKLLDPVQRFFEYVEQINLDMNCDEKEMLSAVRYHARKIHELASQVNNKALHDFAEQFGSVKRKLEEQQPNAKRRGNNLK